ncbi:hypothetical protein [Enterococcus sp. DIV0212c]|uniref:hypothetical protein n=1 Tax=Enterococcus sp. DIV0212c TaxID=2230867 RepID=UPI001AC8FD8B|nr:hypothetical protein [Enterococcus sp. DIV0212c]
MERFLEIPKNFTYIASLFSTTITTVIANSHTDSAEELKRIQSQFSSVSFDVSILPYFLSCLCL